MYLLHFGKHQGFEVGCRHLCKYPMGDRKLVKLGYNALVAREMLYEFGASLIK